MGMLYLRKKNTELSENMQFGAVADIYVAKK